MGYILITGASSGLGLSHAIYLTAYGYQVIGTSRNASKIDITQLKTLYIRDHTKFRYLNKEKTHIKSIKTQIPMDIESKLDILLARIHFISLDITKSESVSQGIQAAIEYVKTNNSTIDVLINNAGNSFFGSIEDLSIEQVQQQFETNYFGQIRMIQGMLPYFREQKRGLIINTASIGGTIAIPFEGQYSATKAAILRMSESLRNEVSPFNIRVSTISPGDINTNFNANTVSLHQMNNSEIKSVDINQMINANPVHPDSPYFAASQKTWQKIIQNLVISPSPSTVSEIILKIIKSPYPKMHYTAGSLLQRIQNWVVRRFATDEFILKGTANFFGLKNV
jgi:short-subunit dehydrogenase